MKISKKPLPISNISYIFCKYKHKKPLNNNCKKLMEGKKPVKKVKLMEGKKPDKKVKGIFSKIKEGLNTTFVSNKKVGNKFMYDSTSYALNFDDMIDKDIDDGRACQSFAARFASPYPLENRKSAAKLTKNPSSYVIDLWFEVFFVIEMSI